MRRQAMLTGWLWVLALVGCGSTAPQQTSEACPLPDGCLGTDRSLGFCQCTAWSVVSDEIVPIKFLVTGVMGTPPGNQSGVAYGDFSIGTPSGKSQLGTRVRAVLVDARGARTVLAADVATGAFGQYGLSVVGSTTLAVGMTPGDGIGLSNVLDIHPTSSHQVFVWVNPTLRVVKDAGGHQTGVWGWSGTCFWPPGTNGGNGCSAPNVFGYSLGELDGSVPSPAYKQAFLQTLEPDELSSIRGYDRMASNPPPTILELMDDPRFLHLGEVLLNQPVTLAPNTGWTPCRSVASDADFPVFASTEIRLSASETVIIEQSWLTTTPTCTSQSPGIAVGTSTPGCQAAATAFVDRMFGTLAFLPESAAAACTTP
jgi:hypothetical protein